MRIDSVNFTMESSRSYSSHMSKRTSAVLLVGGKGLKEKENLWDGLSGSDTEHKQTAEERARMLRDKMNEMSSYSPISNLSYIKSSRDAFSTVRDRCMQYLVKIFLGETKEWDCKELFTQVQHQVSSIASQPVTEVLHSHQEIYFREQEDTGFSTKGTVKTAEGKEYTFSVDVQMSRSFSAYYEENYTQIQTRMCDPLVINLEGNFANLSDQKFFFDINADGEKDEISLLAKGSGYLALDKNEDGIINDGNELFGAESGNGFSDLAAYDSDANGWIDENDEIWKSLLIWTKDEEGKDKCYHLSEKEVGAICLSNADTDFSLNSAQNKTNGMIRRTGFFLYENGNAGTVQHLDIAR